MRRGGSVYVAAVFAILFGYFAYQWWFNPSRAVKRRLGEVAATLSMPAGENPVATAGRLGKLRGFLAPDVRLRADSVARELTSRDEALTAAFAWRPSQNGWDVHFADLRITLESSIAARVYMTVELTTPDPQGHPAVDARDALVGLALREGEWVVTDAELKEPPRQP